jgi:hypothetical protein
MEIFFLLSEHEAKINKKTINKKFILLNIINFYQIIGKTLNFYAIDFRRFLLINEFGIFFSLISMIEKFELSSYTFLNS